MKTSTKTTQEKRVEIYLSVVNGNESFKILRTKRGEYFKKGPYSFHRNKDYVWVESIRKHCMVEKYTEIIAGNRFITMTSKGLKKLNQLKTI